MLAHSASKTRVKAVVPRASSFFASRIMDVEREFAPERTRIQFACAPENCTTLAHLSVSAAIVRP